MNIHRLSFTKDRTAHISAAFAVALAGSIGFSGAAANATVVGVFTGKGYAAAASANIGPIANQLGFLAGIGMGCDGTHGRRRVNQVDSAVIGNLVSAGVARSTVFSDKTATQAIAQSTSEITGLNLLGGLITADAVKSVANVTATSTRISINADGPSLVNLRIAGNPISADVAPNTRISVAGLGTVTVNQGRRT